MKVQFGQFGRYLLIAFALGVFAMGNAEAKKRETKAKNEYPNATRSEPKVEISEKNSKLLNKAYDMLQGDDDAAIGKAQQSLEGIVAGSKSKPYEKGVALAYLSQIAFNADDLPKAIDYNKQALETNALDNRMHFSILYQVAQMALQDDQFEYGLKTLDEYLKLSGVVDAKHQALRGNILLRMERYDEAIAAIKKAISMSDKPESQWNELLIGAYFEKEDFAGAAAFAEGLLAKEPNNMKISQHLAQTYLQLDQEPKALALLESLYTRGLLSSETELKQLFQLYNYVDPPKSKEAIALINTEMAKGRIKPGLDTYRSLADAYMLDEQIDLAIASYAKASGFAKDGEMDMQRAHLLIQEKEAYVEAKALLQTALQKGLKRQGTAWLLIGTAEYNLDNKAAAIVAFQKARTFPDAQKPAETWLKNLKAR